MVAGRYEVCRHLGGGAMAEVYEIKDHGDGSRRALKLLRECWLHDESLRARFDVEGAIQQQLVHPNVVSVSAVISEPSPGIVMELVTGPTLGELIERTGRALDFEAALELLRPVLSAIEYVHGQGVVHRDLKPDNVLLIVEEGGRGIL